MRAKGNIPDSVAIQHGCPVFSWHNLVFLVLFLIDLCNKILLRRYRAWRNIEWAVEIRKGKGFSEEVITKRFSCKDVLLWLAVVPEKLRVKLVPILLSEPVNAIDIKSAIIDIS